MLEDAITAQPRMGVEKLCVSPRRHARAHVVPRVPEQCHGCVWLMTAGATPVCPFCRCVRKHGWVADRG